MDDIIADTGNDKNIEIMIGDLIDHDSIRNVVAEFKKKYDRLDVLINNAGLIFYKKEYTEEGYEKSWALNHLGHFLLTTLLLDVIKTSSPSRIICLSSSGHKFANKKPLEDMNYENKRYGHIKAYGDSKLFNLWFAIELSRRLEGAGVTANAVHPGPIRTGFGKNKNNPWWYRFGYKFAGPFLKGVAKGAATSIHLASSQEGGQITGKYWAKSKVKKTSKQGQEVESQKKLWEISEKLIK
jgi:NAD(P)-dependent dehydrogenase (short-subunit alcohol dehydrogenase family)